MTQPTIPLSANGTTLTLDPDLIWSDEFDWHAIEETVARAITGALIVDQGIRLVGRPISLAPPDDNSAWMPRATLTQLQTWEAVPDLPMVLTLRNIPRNVKFRRHDGLPLSAKPVEFVADPLPGEIGDWYLATLRFLEI